jgi:hypothetical protein
MESNGNPWSTHKRVVIACAWFALSAYLFSSRLGPAMTVQWLDLRRFTCPDCASDELEDGPRGGTAVNRHCVYCGAWWNTIAEIGLIERIREKEPKEPGSRITEPEELAWAFLGIPDLVREWRVAPRALNYTEAQAWAKRAGYEICCFCHPATRWCKSQVRSTIPTKSSAACSKGTCSSRIAKSAAGVCSPRNGGSPIERPRPSGEHEKGESQWQRSSPTTRRAKQYQLTNELRRHWKRSPIISTTLSITFRKFAISSRRRPAGTVTAASVFCGTWTSAAIDKGSGNNGDIATTARF